MSLEKPAAGRRRPREERQVGRAHGRPLVHSQADAPTLALLCQWYKIVRARPGRAGQLRRADRLPERHGGPEVLPADSDPKTASAEIRQLNKQLGITDGHEGAPDVRNVQTKLFSIAERHEARKARAAV